MHFNLSEERQMLKDTIERFLSDNYGKIKNHHEYSPQVKAKHRGWSRSKRWDIYAYWEFWTIKQSKNSEGSFISYVNNAEFRDLNDTTYHLNLSL